MLMFLFPLSYKQQQQKNLKAQDIFYLSLEKSEIENTMQNTLLITSKKINLEDY